MVLLDELEERSTGVYVLRSPVLDELERSDGWEVVPRSTSDVAERLGCVVVPRSPEPSLLLVSAADRLARSPTLLELPELPLIPRAVPLPSLADSPREVAVAEPPSGVPRPHATRHPRTCSGGPFFHRVPWVPWTPGTSPGVTIWMPEHGAK